MNRAFVVIVACGHASLSQGLQTIELVYTSTNSEIPRHEYFAYDYETGAGTRIYSTGLIRSVDPTGIGSTGQAGAAWMQPAEHLTAENAKRMASVVMPQFLVEGIRNDPRADLVSETGEFGGPTYKGEFPAGQRLRSRAEFGNAISIPMEQVAFDFDGQDRLVQVRYGNDERVVRLDLAEDSTSDLSYVQTFADGAWALSEVRITPSTNHEVFTSAYITTLAASRAFELAAAIEGAQSEAASTPEGLRAMQRRRDAAMGGGASASAKRAALILSGIAIAAVGLFAWWKRR